MKPLYQVLALALIQLENCEKSGNVEWAHKADRRIRDMVRNHMPSGSGVDNGTQFISSESTPDKLVFQANYHHMSEHGYYDGWTDHTVTVRPSLAFGVDIKISGPNRNDIKSYLHELIQDCLNTMVEES